MILIQKIKKIKVKGWIQEVLIECIFFIVISVLFLLFLSYHVYENAPKTVILRDEGNKEVEITANEEKHYNFVASSRGKYYYKVGSTRSNNLSEKNKVYFKTSEEAEKLGFKPYIGN